MKTNNQFTNSTTWSFFKRIGYALQVIIIAIAIPLLSYMEMTHVQKTETPSTKNSVIMEKPEAVAVTLK